MIFNSLHFLVFFPIVVLLYMIIPSRFKYLWLLGASYYFYMSWNAKYALLLFTSTMITYVSGLFLSWEKIEDKTKDTWSSSPGIPNLETVVSLLLTQVNKGNIDLSIIPKMVKYIILI